MKFGTLFPHSQLSHTVNWWNTREILKKTGENAIFICFLRLFPQVSFHTFF